MTVTMGGKHDYNILTAFLPDIGVNELMTGAGELSPSITKRSVEHSCITSQLYLHPHHPHANSDPILAAIHSEHPLAKSRQSYSVTACVFYGVHVMNDKIILQKI